MWGDSIAKGMATLFIICIVISAVLGWGLIEGAIWLCKHIAITLV